MSKNNTYVGVNTGGGRAIGQGNVSLGDGAGRTIANGGSFNICLGTDVKPDRDDLDNNLAIANIRDVNKPLIEGTFDSAATATVHINGTLSADHITGGGGGTGIPDAPDDGTLYGRKNRTWTAVPGLDPSVDETITGNWTFTQPVNSSQFVGGGAIPTAGQTAGALLQMQSGTTNDYAWVPAEVATTPAENLLHNADFRVSQFMDFSGVNSYNIPDTAVVFDRWCFEGQNVTGATINVQRHHDLTKGNMAKVEFAVGTSGVWEFWQRIEQEHDNLYAYSETGGSVTWKIFAQFEANPGVHSLANSQATLRWYNVTDDAYVPTTDAHVVHHDFVIWDKDATGYTDGYYEHTTTIPTFINHDPSKEYALELRFHLSESTAVDRVTSGYLYLTHAQFVLGAGAPPFQPEDYATALAHCRRFKQFCYLVSEFPAGSHAPAFQWYTFPTPFRSTPVYNRWDTLSNAILPGSNGTLLAQMHSQPGINATAARMIDMTGVSFGRNDGSRTAGGFYEFTSELGTY